MTEIWHNPRCSKSRAALALLSVHCGPGGFRIVRYLEEPPSRERLDEVVDLLGGDASALLRAKDAPEALARAERDDIVAALVASPFLIERPVVITAKGACVARPPESLFELL
jgi:arsenate reductase